jgi:energy-coupling factor transporter ATP-binding protein EcfA2
MIDQIGIGIFTGVLGNVVYDLLGRKLSRDEIDRFESIVKDLLGKYDVSLDEDAIKDIFNALLLNGEIEEVVKKYGIPEGFIKDLKNSLILDDKLRYIVSEVTKIKLLEEIKDSLICKDEDPKKLIDDYFSYLDDNFKYLDLRGFSPRIGRREIVKIPLDDVFIPLKLRSEIDSYDGRFVYKEKEREENIKIIDFEDLLKYDRCVVLGDPGSGKTTLLKKLAHSVRNPIPIYIRISEYSEKRDKHNDLFDYIISNSKYGKLFEWALVNGKALVLLDGLDEVIDTSIRMKIAEDIRKFVASYSGNKFIVTSRIVGYDVVRLSGFEHYVVIPFGEEEIRRFAKRWYRAIAETSDRNFEEAEKNAEKLVESILKSESIKRLATNPLLLTIIALIHYRGKRLPNRRVELYQVCVETLLEHWVLQRLPSDDYLKDKDELIEVLSPIAFRIHSTSPSGLIDEDTLIELMVDVMVNRLGYNEKIAKKEAKEFKKYVEEECGLFLEKGRDENLKSLYGFLHLSFQEYLASLEFIRRWKMGKLRLKDYVFDPRWIEIVRLAVAELGTRKGDGRLEASRLVEDILNVEDEFEDAKRPLILAGYILSDDVRLEPNLERRIIDDLFETALSVLYLGDEMFYFYSGFARTIRNVLEELLNSEKKQIVADKIKNLAFTDARAIWLLDLLGLDALDVLAELSKSNNIETLRALAWTLRGILWRSLRFLVFTKEIKEINTFIKTISEIVDRLLLKDDFVVMFGICSVLEDRHSRHVYKPTKNLKNLKKITSFENFKKVSLILFDIIPLKAITIPLDKLIEDDNPKIAELAKWLKKIEADIWGRSPYWGYYPVVVFYTKKGIYALVTTQNYDIIKFEVPKDSLNLIETVKSMDIPYIARLQLIEMICKSEDFPQIIKKCKNDLDVLLAIARGLKFEMEWGYLKPPKIITDDPAIKLLLAYINDEQPSKEVIEACLERYRSEDNENNKKALFALLFHFLNPFKVLKSF